MICHKCKNDQSSFLVSQVWCEGCSAPIDWPDRWCEACSDSCKFCKRCEDPDFNWVGCKDGNPYIDGYVRLIDTGEGRYWIVCGEESGDPWNSGDRIDIDWKLLSKFKDKRVRITVEVIE